MKTSISDLVHSRNEAYKRLALEVDIGEERLVEIETVVTSLGSGRLSKSVISPRKLRETLAQIEENLPENYTLLFSSEDALWPYYSSLGATAVFASDLEDIVVTVSIPLVDSEAVLELNRVHNLPLKVKDGYSVMADISTEYLVTDRHKEFYLELFKEDFQDCQIFHHPRRGGEHFYCGLEPLLRADTARSCVMQLYQGDEDPAWCQSRLRHGMVQPFTRLYNGSWIFAALTEQVPVTMQCPSGDTPTFLVGFGVISLDEGCTISSHDFWYAHTYAGMGEVNLSFGDKNPIDDDDDDDFEEEYDLSNFENDVMFVDDDAEDALVLEQEIKQEEAETSTEAEVHAYSANNESDPEEVEDESEESEEDAKAISNGDGVINVQNPVDGNDATEIYKNILLRLKDTFNSGHVIIG